ncbi:hypothetical protein DFH28DRAFT_1077418 [Melampsora americana]|nr:hypothetical protein DFH28DRAFT_1077418 [Melampsora americana]
MSFNPPSIQPSINNNQNKVLISSEIDHSMNHSISTPSHLHTQVDLSQPHHPNHSIGDTFDPGFQVPSTEGLGLLPPPVAYKDFPSELEECSGKASSLLLSIPSDLSQTCLVNSNHTWIDPSVMRTATQLVPPPTASSATDQSSFNPSLPNPNSSSTSSSTLPYYDPSHPSSQSTSSLPPISMSNYPSPHDSNERTAHDLPYYPNPSKLITPPPLFDQSEQDLFSSFLNIFGDFNGEWDFDPQGMPEGMPVLGELKRRLEAENHENSMGRKEKIEAEEMGREVADRLKISESDSNPISSRPPTRLSSHSPTRTRQATVPPLISRPFTSSQIDLPSENEESGRKKAKLKETQFMQPIVTSAQHELPIGLPGAFDDGNDVEMTQLRDEALVSGPSDWELTHHPLPIRFNEPNYPEAHRTQHHSSTSRMSKNTHMVSEQKRRNAIQGGFGSLVEILRLGESQSGITIGIVEKPNLMKSNIDQRKEGTMKVKSGRGRGRRGEIETGASKSLYLEEVQRLEGLMKSKGLEI